MNVYYTPIINSSPYEKENHLIREVKRESLIEVQALIASKANVNFIDSKGLTALEHAVDKHNVPIVQTLLEARASPNLSTALITSVKTQSLAITQLLINASDNLEPILGVQCLLYQKDLFGQTALMWAAAQDNEKLVRLLLDQGAKVDDVDQKKNTALLHAAKSKSSIGIALLLIQAQADIHLKDHSGRSPLLVSQRTRNLDLYSVLFQLGARMPRVQIDADNIKVRYINPRPDCDNIADIARRLCDAIQPTNLHRRLHYNPFLEDVRRAVEKATPEIPAIDQLLRIVKKKYASIKVFLTAAAIEEVIDQQERLEKDHDLKSYDYEEYDEQSLQAAIHVYRIVQSMDTTMSVSDLIRSLQHILESQKPLAKSIEAELEEQVDRATPHTLTSLKSTSDVKQILTYPVIRHRMPGRGSTHADYIKLKEAILGIKTQFSA